ncbi:TRAP transporter large permease [Synergistes jonesii]|uniref:TRAP transporter large permease n=1 Tax=Synergistes jonesii TaxID=2754 RepID=UPI00243046CB|nr:TRAP transporter large permease [Synergistes jonesii]
MTLISMIVLLTALAVGIPVALAFLASTTCFVIGGYSPAQLVPYGFNKAGAMVLIAIAMFILAGQLMRKGEIGDKLIDLVELKASKIKAGLGVVGVVSCALFGSCTGSASATISCIGSILFPRLEKAGYPKAHSAALLSNAATLGMLIPPSGTMILYAWLGGQSVLACFLASVIPGIILTAQFSLINCFLMRNVNLVKIPKMSKEEKRKESRRRTKRALPAFVMPIIVLGGIYSGLMTPTEAAGCAAIYAIPLGLYIYKTTTWKEILNCFVDSAANAGAIMFMLFSVMILSKLYIMEDVPNQIVDLLLYVSDNKYVILMMINVFLFIIGMIMDDTSGILLVTPILVPIILKLGFDPIHFSAIVAVNLGMGNTTPPAAPLLYLGSRLGDAPLGDMLKPCFYLIVFGWIPNLILTTFCPILSTWLPKLILG